MKSIKTFIGILSILILVSSCGSDPSQKEVTINAKLTYDGNPLVMFEDYTYPTGETLFFTRFSFFIDNLNLGENQVIERDYIDLTNAHLTSADAIVGERIATTKLDPGTYDMTFGIGVDQDLNSKTPIDFDAGDVLSMVAEYWPGWESYVFVKAEGKIDLDGDGTKETGFALHLGDDGAYRNITYQNIDLENNDNTTITIDLKSFFGQVGAYYDIASVPQIHTPEQDEQVAELADNLTQAFGN